VKPTKCTFTTRPKQQPLHKPEPELSNFSFTSRNLTPDPGPGREDFRYTSQINPAVGPGLGPRTRSRNLSVSTISTVSTSFKLGLEDVTAPDIRDEVLPGFQYLTIGDHAVREENQSKPGRRTTVIEDPDGDMECGWPGGGADAGQSITDIINRGIIDNEEEEQNGKGKQRRHGAIGKSKNRHERDGEIMMAIFNGTEQLGTVTSVRMCLDEAGRWRIGWGQLVD